MPDDDAAQPVPGLIAHRGDARRYPENTIPALRSAIEAGATHVEFDVQLSADHVPVLMHDADLQRMTGARGRVMDLSSSELRCLAVHDPRAAGGTPGVVIPMLAEVIDLFRLDTRVTVFVELKPESLEAFGVEVMVDRVRSVLEPVAAQCVIISFDPEAITYARETSAAAAIGWVIHEWSDSVHLAATVLAPEYLFCDHRLLPADESPLWPGPWRWAVYEVVDAGLALRLAARGADLVETMAIAEMIRDPEIRRGGHRA
ncbi:MAG: glycerophosphodiester phosphodiesterase family protein [Planctomycetota bacterium]|jgi:glycerophosphoryl diester phosphodiesterase